MFIESYNRQGSIEYAREWALKRNPAYYNFDKLGGDCTNFASQCIYAGSGVMNHKPTYGWYYYNGNNRTPSWTGVQYLYNFLINNKEIGPFAEETDQYHIEPGDVVQLGTFEGGFYHSPVIVAVGNGELYVAAHTQDEYMRPLNTYSYEKIRFLHIKGVRKG